MASSKKVKVVLLASEWSSKHGGISTFNRVLAIQLAQNPKVAVSVFLPECDQTERDAAKNNNITLVQAEPRPGFDKMLWLCHPPKDLEIDFVIGHGVVLGRQAQFLRDNRSCKWVQFVHTEPEELGMFKDYADAVSKGEEKHQTEVKLCEMADFVVAVGPKLAEVYRSYLRHCGKDIFELTPGIFSEFSNVRQSTQEGGKFRVLSFGRGDAEDFHLKGFDIAAKAVANLNDAYLIFVGAASKEQDEVAARLKECNLPPSRLRVRAYMDEREGLKQLFSGVDLAIMPSRTEGFGLAALEALSAGLPVLVSANSGFGEALGKVPFGSGCVISSDDARVWAEEIGKVMTKPRVTRLEESKSILENYAKKYNWQEQTRDLVEKIMAIRKGSLRISSSEGAKKRKGDPLSTEEPAPKTSKTTSSSNPRDADHAEDATSGISDDETKPRKTDSNPPEVDVTLLTNRELPKKSKRLDLEQLPIDILLLTVQECEFLACLSLLMGFSRMFQKDVGDVYIGNIGEMKIAVMKCRMGAAGPGGAAGVVRDAVKALTPKAVFCVGYCGGLQPVKVKLGDVVISEVLITYAHSKVTKDGIEERGDRVPLKPNLAKVILNAAAGWSAPLRDQAELEVERVRRGALLSGPQEVDDNDLREALLNRFPGAIAIEMEGEGVYSAAQDLNVEWIIIKGVSDFADGKISETNAWRPFASIMAASFVAHILSNPIIFEDWPHYNNGKTSLRPSSGERGEHGGRKGSGSEPPSKGKKKPVSGDKVERGEHAGGKGSGSGPPSKGKKKPVFGDKGERGQHAGGKGSGSGPPSKGKKKPVSGDKDSPSTSSSAGAKKRKGDSLSTEEPAPETSKTTSSSNPSDADHAEDATSEISDDDQGERGEHGAGRKGSGSEPPSKVKVGCPSEDELEELSIMLSDNWKAFGRRLGFVQARITAFDKENVKLSDKAYAMLMEWKEREGSDGTYKVLYDALCHKLVGCKLIAEKICYV